jgi:excinuclease ABC subunit C
MTNPLNAQLLAQVARFPVSPGVYLMKDAADTVLYVGKAVNLKNRVRSYFSDSHETRTQIPLMLAQLAAIDWIATGNEAEALILEANLIRKHSPRYNIDLRDDKHFPYLKVTLGEEFPRLQIVRRVENDGARYFGPYTEATAMRRLAALAKRIFNLCDCAGALPSVNKRRPCINYAMHRCCGACAGKISQQEYRTRIDDLLKFLSGKRNHLLRDLETRMEQASSRLAFEEAALLRDQIQLIREASRLQQVDLKLPDVNCDAFGLAESEHHRCLAVLMFREGLLLSSYRFVFRRELWEMPSPGHDAVILQFYSGEGREPPSEILLPEGGAFDVRSLQQWLDGRTGDRSTVIVPKKGVKRRLIAMAGKNARLHLAQKSLPSAADDCALLQKALRLPKPPEIIEAFDISNLGGSFCVAGMVQFKNGAPNKQAYRRYKIKSVDGQNDFAMIMEAVSRRLTRLRNENSPFPDLLLIDGGKGQLGAAVEALAAFTDPPRVAALAKQEELLFSPEIEGPIRLPAAHPARRLAERIRDEVHRYAVSFHRTVRGKQFSRSKIEDLPGIGPAKANLLLKTFGSLKRLKEATPEEIAKVKGFTLDSALILKNNSLLS